MDLLEVAIGDLLKKGVALPEEEVFSLVSKLAIAIDSMQERLFLNDFDQALIAPEERRFEKKSAKGDTYAFGALTYFLLMGHFPEGYFPLPSTRSFKGNWDTLIKETLSFEPEKRAEKLEPLLQNIYLKKPSFTESVVIPAGTYLRGSNQGNRDEMPKHPVHLPSFAIDIHPVTNEQFVHFLQAFGTEKDTDNHDIIRLRDSRISRVGGQLQIENGYAQHPVVGVTWYGAHAYCQWVGKRLPTEAEWEVAACGGLESILYPTGAQIDKTKANFFSSDTMPVMSYPPNGYGLYDMAGNVYQWCADWYNYHYYEASLLEPNNPQGPAQGVYRVLRGGCWKSLKEDMRCSHRHRNNPGSFNRTYGFRCASSI